MGIKKEAFVNYTLDEDKNNKKNVFSVKLNDDERTWLDKCKKIIEQPKDSTALKTLAELGAKVILEEKTAFILDTLFKNKRNNKRTGLIEF